MSMKVECPVCHVQGILEQRGNSQRVLHYRGISNGKRLYEKHSIKMGVMGVNGNKTLGIKDPNAVLFSDKMVGLERFELSSIAPEATSLDQASRQPRFAARLQALSSFTSH